MENVVKSEVFFNWKEKKKVVWGWGKWNSIYLVKDKTKKFHSLSETRRKFDYKISNLVRYQRAFTNPLKDNLARII